MRVVLLLLVGAGCALAQYGGSGGASQSAGAGEGAGSHELGIQSGPSVPQGEPGPYSGQLYSSMESAF